jgi:hypothetical protein
MVTLRGRGNSKIPNSCLAPILFELKAGDLQGPLSQFQAVALDNEQEMFLLLKSISQESADIAHSNWEMTFKYLWGQLEKEIAALPRDIQDQIQITSPIDGGTLEDPRPWADGLSYVIRGSLTHLPEGHAIRLINASNDGRRQWPQGFSPVRYQHPRQGEWEGRIYLPYKNPETVIDAVVAPPTSKQLFEYYQQHGGGHALTHIPMECKNKTQTWVKAPRSHKAPPSHTAGE